MTWVKLVATDEEWFFELGDQAHLIFTVTAKRTDFTWILQEIGWSPKGIHDGQGKSDFWHADQLIGEECVELSLHQKWNFVHFKGLF